jgi:soluble lytic murein transglycosylase-like protein
VNPDFIRALILAESNCKSRALSCKNARGLTQIIYTTGKQAARELVRKDFDYKYVSKEQLQHLQP